MLWWVQGMRYCSGDKLERSLHRNTAFIHLFIQLFIYPTDFDGRMDEIMKRYQNGFEQAMYDEQDQAYLTFRFGADAKKDSKIVHGKVRHFYNQTGNILNFPLYNNSFYFYFGLKDGSTALDEFNKQFFSICSSKSLFMTTPAITTNEEFNNCPYL